MTGPLVSAIMPTRGRSDWAQHALRSFLSQTYEAKELIILDDFDEPSFHDSIRFFSSAVKYERVTGQRSIAKKRNRCCELAAGELVMHFDSDDWSAKDRMEDQVQRVLTTRLAMTGYHSILFYDVLSLKWGKYNGAANYALGTSLCYRRTWWEAHPFAVKGDVGEDNEMVFTTVAASQLSTVDGQQRIVARVHEDNTSVKFMSGYAQVPVGHIPAEFFV